MTDAHKDQQKDIGRSAARKQAARDNPGPSPLRGIGVFGVIGWSVAVPVVAGTFLGLWLDRTHPQTFSWTIALIVGGAVVGGALAWAWIEKEKDE